VADLQCKTQYWAAANGRILPPQPATDHTELLVVHADELSSTVRVANSRTQRTGKAAASADDPDALLDRVTQTTMGDNGKREWDKMNSSMWEDAQRSVFCKFYRMVLHKVFDEEDADQLIGSSNSPSALRSFGWFMCPVDNWAEIGASLGDTVHQPTLNIIRQSQKFAFTLREGSGLRLLLCV
jgi:hypothetical protein